MDGEKFVRNLISKQLSSMDVPNAKKKSETILLPTPLKSAAAESCNQAQQTHNNASRRNSLAEQNIKGSLVWDEFVEEELAPLQNLDKSAELKNDMKSIMTSILASYQILTSYCN